MSGHLTSEDLVLIAYGELENGEHLENCAECRAELENLKRFVGALPGLPAGDPGPEYEQDVWKSIEHRLPPARVIPFRTQWVWKAMAAAAALIVAFMAGQWTRPRPAAQRVALSEQARQRILQVAVLDHLERSRITLTEWMNLDATQDIEPESERLRAEDLLRENRLYRQSALATGDAALNAVLEELERTLLDIARSPAKPAPEDVKRIQERMDEQGTLFKVRVAGESLSRDRIDDSVVRF